MTYKFYALKLAVMMAILTSLLSTACYRMPSEDEYSVVPRFNNPDVIREKPGNCSPSVNY